MASRSILENGVHYGRQGRIDCKLEITRRGLGGQPGWLCLGRRPALPQTDAESHQEHQNCEAQKRPDQSAFKGSSRLPEPFAAERAAGRETGERDEHQQGENRDAAPDAKAGRQIFKPQGMMARRQGYGAQAPVRRLHAIPCLNAPHQRHRAPPFGVSVRHQKNGGRRNVRLDREFITR